MLVNLTDVFLSEGKVVNKEYLMDVCQKFDKTLNQHKENIMSK